MLSVLRFENVDVFAQIARAQLLFLATGEDGTLSCRRDGTHWGGLELSSHKSKWEMMQCSRPVYNHHMGSWVGPALYKVQWRGGAGWVLGWALVLYDGGWRPRGQANSCGCAIWCPWQTRATCEHVCLCTSGQQPQKVCFSGNCSLTVLPVSRQPEFVTSLCNLHDFTSAGRTAHTCSFTMEATAKYDYKATAGDELSFRKGEQLKILQTSGNWYKAELNGSEGFVPKNFINIHLPSWYQEDYSRSDAQQKLTQQPVGAFLIRGSGNTAQGDFSISVRHAADVQHFKVLRDSRGQYYLWSEKFPSLNQLVEYYKNTSVSKQSQIFLQETQQQQRGGSDNLPPLPSLLPAPPLSHCPPTLAPQQPKASSKLQVRALYSFHAEERDELEFNAGDIISVLDCSNQTWWKGELRGKAGLFPSSYTQPI